MVILISLSYCNVIDDPLQYTTLTNRCNSLMNLNERNTVAEKCINTRSGHDITTVFVVRCNTVPQITKTDISDYHVHSSRESFRHF